MNFLLYILHLDYKNSITKDKTPLEDLEEQLHIAIETENYEKAAQLRDQLQRLRG